MVLFILAVTGIVCIIAGWFIADSISDKRFQKRQNYMEKLNRKF